MLYNIGIPKELKNNEKRVALIPNDILKLKKIYNNIFVETNAGINSNYTDNDYISMGAIICKDIKELYSKANLIIKVKEPQEEEYPLINESHIILAFFHFAGNINLINAMLNSKAICIAYETILDNNNIPVILYPMSKIAGENAIIEAHNFITKFNKTDNIITLIGVGNVGLSSLNKALEYGYNNINLIDKNYEKIKNIKNNYSNYNINIYEMNNDNLNILLKKSNIIIGSIYNSASKTDKIINNDMLNIMPINSIFIDVSIDQGGMTSQSIPTTYDNPIIKYNNTNLFCVPNIPSINGKKSSDILSETILPYLLKILNCVDKFDIFNDFFLKNAINISNGKILNKNII